MSLWPPPLTLLAVRLQALMRPILDERLTPLIRTRYPNVCESRARGPNRHCTPCYSLVRRYRPGERRSHETHYDAHALVTAVISLADHGAEYTGGLHLATSSAGSRESSAVTPAILLPSLWTCGTLLSVARATPFSRSGTVTALFCKKRRHSGSPLIPFS